jgi:hypothetical protein
VLDVDLAEEVEQRAEELGMPRAVEALAVVLDGELPVAVLEDIDLAGDLRMGEVVRREIGQHARCHLVEVLRWLVGETYEDEPGERLDVHGLERALLRRRLTRGTAADDLAVEVVGPAVIGALERRARNA